MTARKKAIPLSVAEDQLLRHLYLEFGFPSDQYARRQPEKRRFVERWNDLAERQDDAEDVMHYIITQRKQKKWVKFNGTHKRLASMPSDFLSPTEWEALKSAYSNVLVSRGLGSDNIRFDAELASELGKAFYALTSRRVNASLLLAAIEAKRKRGEWITITNRGMGFKDIDEVG